MGQEIIVIIAQADIVRCGDGDAPIPCGADALVLHGEPCESGVREPGLDLRIVHVAAVVDDDDFIGVFCLAFDVLKTSPQLFGPIVRGDDDSDGHDGLNAVLFQNTDESRFLFCSRPLFYERSRG